MTFDRSNWGPVKRAADGSRLCRNCGSSTFEKYRKTYCSKTCEEAFYIANSPGFVKRKVYLRDGGICALCSVDCNWLREFFGKNVSRGFWRMSDLAGVWLRAYGIPLGRSTTDWWDADHIVPVIEGGGQCGLDNYRTLCIPCHQAETAKLAHRRAVDRADQARPLLRLLEG